MRNDYPPSAIEHLGDRLQSTRAENCFAKGRRTFLSSDVADSVTLEKSRFMKLESVWKA